MGEVTPEMVKALLEARRFWRGVMARMPEHRRADFAVHMPAPTFLALLSEWEERGKELTRREEIIEDLAMSITGHWKVEDELESSLAEARAEAKDYEDVIVRGQKALGDAGVTPGANGDLHPGIAELADQLAEARERVRNLEAAHALGTHLIQARTRERDSASEKLAQSEDDLRQAREIQGNLRVCIAAEKAAGDKAFEEAKALREKLAKVVRLVDVIKRANEPCDAEDGYCVHCACVEALAAAKGE